MKKLLMFISLLFFISSTHAASVTTGETITVDFDLTGDADVEAGARQIWWHLYTVPFGGDADLAINPGESFIVNWYESSGDTIPLQTDDITKTRDITFDIYSIGNSYNIDGLTDYKGQLEFTDIIGDFEVSAIAMRVWNQDGSFTNYVNQDFRVHTPIPAALWLFGSGLLGLIAIARRR